jgi:hypothetical protein
MVRWRIPSESVNQRFELMMTDLAITVLIKCSPLMFNDILQLIEVVRRLIIWISILLINFYLNAGQCFIHAEGRIIVIPFVILIAFINGIGSHLLDMIFTLSLAVECIDQSLSLSCINGLLWSPCLGMSDVLDNVLPCFPNFFALVLKFTVSTVEGFLSCQQVVAVLVASLYHFMAHLVGIWLGILIWLTILTWLGILIWLVICRVG